RSERRTSLGNTEIAHPPIEAAEIADILGQDVLQMALIEYEHVVQALRPDRSHPALGDRGLFQPLASASFDWTTCALLPGDTRVSSMRSSWKDHRITCAGRPAGGMMSRIDFLRPTAANETLADAMRPRAHERSPPCYQDRPGKSTPQPRS